MLAIGQLAELLVDRPTLGMAAGSLGLFVMLWWTWVGFAVLYNRSTGDGTAQRLLFLAASAPIAAAAVATHPQSHGHSTPFIVSLAVTRLLLAASRARDDDPDSDFGDALRRQIGRAYLLSATLLIISIWVPAPFRYFVWAAAIAQESRAMFSDPATARKRSDDRGLRHAPTPAAPPADPADAINAHHFAERFGLFIIILLGELFLQVGEAAAEGRAQTFSTWAGLIAGAMIAGGLWWSYFDVTADIDLRALEVSGGSPTTARLVFAVGHMLPAFALLLTAAGVGLLARHDPPSIAYWLTSIGAGGFLSATRAVVHVTSRVARGVEEVLTAAVFALGVLHHIVDPTAFLWIVAVCTVGSAALSTGLAALMRVEEDSVHSSG